MGIKEKYKEWKKQAAFKAEIRKGEQQQMNVGELMFRQGKPLTGKEGLFIQKGWFKGQKDVLDTERHKEKQKRRVATEAANMEIARLEAKNLKKKGKNNPDTGGWL